MISRVSECGLLFAVLVCSTSCGHNSAPRRDISVSDYLRLEKSTTSSEGISLTPRGIRQIGNTIIVDFMMEGSEEQALLNSAEIVYHMMNDNPDRWFGISAGDEALAIRTVRHDYPKYSASGGFVATVQYNDSPEGYVVYLDDSVRTLVQVHCEVSLEAHDNMYRIQLLQDNPDTTTLYTLGRHYDIQSDSWQFDFQPRTTPLRHERVLPAGRQAKEAGSHATD